MRVLTRPSMYSAGPMTWGKYHRRWVLPTGALLQRKYVAHELVTHVRALGLY